MPIPVKIPTMMLKLTNQRHEVSVKAKTVREMLDRLDRECPGAKELILSPDGTTIHHHFLICVNDEDVRYLEGIETPLANGDRVEIVASIAGG